MWKITLLSVGVAVCLLVLTSADSQVEDAVNKEGSKYCPLFAPGSQKCPSSNIFYTYQCCGTLLHECCFKLQTWVYIVLGVIGCLILSVVVVSVIRCVFCK